MPVTNKHEICKEVALIYARDAGVLANSKNEPAKYAASIALIYIAMEAALAQGQTKEGINSIATLLSIPSEKLQSLLQLTEHSQHAKKHHAEQHSPDAQ